MFCALLALTPASAAVWKPWAGGGAPFFQLASQLARSATNTVSSAREPLPLLKIVWVQILQLGGLTRVPLAFLCRYSESIQSTIPVIIPGQLTS